MFRADDAHRPSNHPDYFSFPFCVSFNLLKTPSRAYRAGHLLRKIKRLIRAGFSIFLRMWYSIVDNLQYIQRLSKFLFSCKPQACPLLSLVFLLFGVLFSLCSFPYSSVFSTVYESVCLCVFFSSVCVCTLLDVVFGRVLGFLVSGEPDKNVT